MRYGSQLVAARALALLFALLAVGRASELAAAEDGDGDTVLLPNAISELDIDLRGRYVRQWKQEDGTLALLFNGQFELTMGARRLSSANAVVWIEPQRSDDNRKYYDLTIYLADQAEVREPGGTVTTDNVLLVSNIATFGRITKSQDAHSPENMEQSDLYERAMRDRAAIEAGQPISGGVAPSIARPQEPRPPRRVEYVVRGGIEPAQTADGEPVQVASGGVYFSLRGGTDSAVLEIQADRAVIFLARGERAAVDAPAASSAEPAGAAVLSSADGDENALRRVDQPTPAPDPKPPAATGAEDQELQLLERSVSAAYLEGDVLLVYGDRVVRAERLYYDFARYRALILDGVFRVDIPERQIPLYVRADEIRQLSAREFSASKARVTTSEFYSPHYHVGADKVYIRDRTQRDAQGRTQRQIAGTYEMVNTTLNVAGVPIGYWPYSRGDVEASETLLRRFSTGYSGDFGVEAQTTWNFFSLIGAERPPGYDADLQLDYFSDRGPAIGINTNYQRDDYYGLSRGYYIRDRGDDNFGPFRDNSPDTENRGRLLWRHRHYLPNDWEATLEFAYLSDPGFLEEYRKSEWFEGKEQETVLYLKRAKDTEAVTFLANWRTVDFVRQTEHLPELAYRRIGDTLGPLGFYHESRVGAVRFRPEDERDVLESLRFRNDRPTDMTARADVRQEAELPLKLPGGNLVPFATVRGSAWDGQPLASGALWRGFGVYGLRGASYLSRVFDDVRSELFDIDRIRHVIRPELAAWVAHSNVRSDEITPFDEGIENIDAFYGAVFGVKQAWQTKRGAASAQRTVDLLTLNVEAGLFGGDDIQEREKSVGYGNPLRPENSRTRNYAALDAAWRISDSTSLLYDLNYDLNDQHFDRHDISLAIERTPRLAYVLGWRSANDIDLSLVGGGFNYRLNEKHILSARTWYDLDRAKLGEITITYVRKLPRWYVGVTVEFDEVFDDTRFYVSLWPEGIPEWTLGSRRFTGLATSTGIRP